MSTLLNKQGKEYMYMEELKTKETLMSKIAELQQQTETENKNIHDYWLSKRKSTVIIWFGGAALGAILLFSAAAVGDTFGEILFCLLAMVIIGMPVAFMIIKGVWNAKITNSRKIVTTNNETIPKLSAELKELVTNELCQQFAITPYQLDYDLNSILTPDMKNDWWCVQGKIDVVCTALSRKYQRTANDMAKSDLEVENLKLQNESIAIDNVQKKFWTCQFCGNMNRADDMSCIKCGAIRPSME